MSLQEVEISIKRLLMRVRNNLYAAFGVEEERERGRENYYAILLCPPVHSRGREQTAVSWARINPRSLCYDHQRSLLTKPSEAYESLFRLHYDFKRPRWWAPEHVRAFPFRWVPPRGS